MDDYFDRLMEKIPGANVAERRSGFPLFFLLLIREKFPKNRHGSLCAGVSPSLGTVNIRQCKF